MFRDFIVRADDQKKNKVKWSSDCPEKEQSWMVFRLSRKRNKVRWSSDCPSGMQMPEDAVVFVNFQRGRREAF